LSPYLASIHIEDENEQAFSNADYIILVGAKPRGPGMDRIDLLKSNAKLFKSQSSMIEKGMKPDVKILVVGNPCNTNALAILNGSVKIKPGNVSALSKLDETRAIAAIANELQIPSFWIRNVGIWGNHSKTMVVDVSNAFYVKGLEPKTLHCDIPEGCMLRCMS
jgi:malate/lactate dehydrogenase